MHPSSEPLLLPRHDDYADLLARVRVARRRRGRRLTLTGVSASLVVWAIALHGISGDRQSLELTGPPPYKRPVPTATAMPYVSMPTGSPDARVTAGTSASSVSAGPPVTLRASRSALPAPPPGAEPRTRPVRITVFDATTYDSALSAHVAPLYTYLATAPATAMRRFAVASSGWDDPGSGVGRVSVDDLVVDRTDGSSATFRFDTEPSIRESHGRIAHDALTYDPAASCLVALANSEYGSDPDYQSIAVDGANGATARRVTFRLTRMTGKTGDGSYWDLVFGLVPGDDEATVAAPRRGAPRLVDNLVGLHMAGDGDGDAVDVRGDDRAELLRGVADGGIDAASAAYSVGSTYVVEISLGDA